MKILYKKNKYCSNKDKDFLLNLSECDKQKDWLLKKLKELSIILLGIFLLTFILVLFFSDGIRKFIFCKKEKIHTNEIMPNLNIAFDDVLSHF